MPVSKLSAFGWANCARLSNERLKLIVTLDVGPRILSYRTDGGPNILRTFPRQLGTAGEAEYFVRGGHRIWLAPESPRTYEPDNGPVEFEVLSQNAVRVATPAGAGPALIRKELTISLLGDAAVQIRHRATNQSAEPVTLATWGLTVPIPGGFVIVPQPALGEHRPGNFEPDRVIVPWNYTDLSDDRWKIGRRYWLLRPDPARAATKLGFALRHPWVAYAVGNSLFVLRFEFEEGALYPDFGCNYETFSKGDFIELETLGPLRTLLPGQSTEHSETWHLFDGVAPPASVNEEALGEWLDPFLRQIGIS